MATAGFRITGAEYHRDDPRHTCRSGVGGNRQRATVSTAHVIVSGIYCLDMAKPKQSKRKRARVLSSQVSYRGPVFSVTTDEVLEPGGIRARRDVVRHSGSVVVLALDEDESVSEPRVLLERQYRHAAQGFMWELPAGRVDEGEPELAAAKRELLEETGYTASRWKKILHFYVSPGFLDETMSIYLARGLRAGIAQPEADEKITIRFFPLSRIERMARRGVIRDAKTIAGILWLAGADSALNLNL
jgi:ADP-ribose pyrophosphatase